MLLKFSQGERRFRISLTMYVIKSTTYCCYKILLILQELRSFLTRVYQSYRLKCLVLATFQSIYGIWPRLVFQISDIFSKISIKFYYFFLIYNSSEPVMDKRSWCSDQRWHRQLPEYLNSKRFESRHLPSLPAQLTNDKKILSQKMSTGYGYFLCLS